MKILLLLVVITCHQLQINAQGCQNPSIQRKQMFIYRTSPFSIVKTMTCSYTDGRRNFNGIKEDCKKAMTDDFGNLPKNSEIDSTYDFVDFDPLMNKIWLKTGTPCPYDAGFCYDPRGPKGTVNVWSVEPPAPREVCPNKLYDIEQIFYGFVDFWEFQREQKNYIVYNSPRLQKGFTFSLTNTSMCHDVKVWHTEEGGYLVSTRSLFGTIKATPKLNRRMFPTFQATSAIRDYILEHCRSQDQSANSIPENVEVNPKDRKAGAYPTISKKQFELLKAILSDHSSAIREFVKDVKTYIGKVKTLELEEQRLLKGANI